jgi:hypothetical protein
MTKSEVYIQFPLIPIIYLLWIFWFSGIRTQILKMDPGNPTESGSGDPIESRSNPKHPDAQHSIWRCTEQYESQTENSNWFFSGYVNAKNY